MQSLRVVDSLEESYPNYNGLNLTFETREGILKHCSRRNARHLEAREPSGVARRFVDPSPGAPKWRQPSLEAQLANLADEIAYNAHDIDDGVRSGLLDMDQLDAVELFRNFRREALQYHPHLKDRRLLFETIRRMLSAQVYDVMDATRAALEKSAPPDPHAVCQLPALVCFSDDMALQSTALKRFLHANLYRHPQVVQTTQAAQQVVRDLFEAYMSDPAQMPQAHIDRFEGLDGLTPLQTPNTKPERVVADYIAGMTDRFATREHVRLTGSSAFAQS
jgi:dGTPase